MTLAVLREVRLYGQLGAQFGRVHYLAINTAHEAVRALCATVPSFKSFLLSETRLGYKVIVGRVAKRLDEIHEPTGAQVIKIVPVVGGEKSKGLGMILAGVALFFGAPIIGGLMGSTAAGGVVALYGSKLGVALMLGGVLGLLAPQRKGGSEPRAENQPSYAFDGPVNTTQQGLPVPVGYGRCLVGSAVISAGMSVDDTSPAPPAPPPPPPPPLPADQNWTWESYIDGR
jgi:predicted phage tail protein